MNYTRSQTIYLIFSSCGPERNACLAASQSTDLYIQETRAHRERCVWRNKRSRRNGCADAVSEPGVQWACRSSKCRGPCLHCKGQRASGRFPPGPYRPGFRRAVLWQSSGWGRAAGARLRVMRPTATLEGSTELTRPRSMPRSCLLVRRVVLEASGSTGRLSIAPMTSEAIFRRPPQGGSLGEALPKTGTHSRLHTMQMHLDAVLSVAPGPGICI